MRSHTSRPRCSERLNPLQCWKRTSVTASNAAYGSFALAHRCAPSIVVFLRQFWDRLCHGP